MCNDLKTCAKNAWHIFEKFATASVDTAMAYRGLANGSCLYGLSSMLDDLKIPYGFLHNAGNDATYTLRALVQIAIETLEGRR